MKWTYLSDGPVNPRRVWVAFQAWTDPTWKSLVIRFGGRDITLEMDEARALLDWLHDNEDLLVDNKASQE